MKRVCVSGTPLYEKGEITDLELTKIIAVTRLVTRPKKSMNVHEPPLPNSHFIVVLPTLSGIPLP